MTRYTVSIVIPCYNEEKKIGITIQKLSTFLRKKPWKAEIILANDGSIDRTVERVQKLTTKLKLMNIRIVEHYPNKGRGAILIKAFLKANSNKVIYMDADLATDLCCLSTMIEALDKSDIATGSRLLRNSQVKRPLTRELLSRGYNYLVRLILRSPFRDHQCGFKGFRKKCLNNILPFIESSGWFWDTEILLVGNSMGYKISEFPIRWQEYREKGGSKVKIVNTILNYLTNITWLRGRISKYPKYG